MSTMDLESAQELVEVIQDFGYEAEIREGYSGRFMYGKTEIKQLLERRDLSVTILGAKG